MSELTCGDPFLIDPIVGVEIPGITYVRVDALYSLYSASQ